MTVLGANCPRVVTDTNSRFPMFESTSSGTCSYSRRLLMTSLIDRPEYDASSAGLAPNPMRRSTCSSCRSPLAISCGWLRRASQTDQIRHQPEGAFSARRQLAPQAETDVDPPALPDLGFDQRPA